MRCLYFVLVAAIVPSTGCSAFVAARGTDLNTFETREQVLKDFGAPTVTGHDEQLYDEFRTHRKIAENWKGIYIIMECGATLGLSEFIRLPNELYCASRQRIKGQTVRFIYDASGTVIGVLVNGKPPILSRHANPAKLLAPVAPEPQRGP